MNSPKNNSQNNMFEQLGENIPVNTRVVKNIRSMVLNGALQPGDRLPNEFELAEKLNVSRGALRDALQILEKTGFIIRRHGVGTFISENPMTSNNLNVNLGITQVIESSGADAGTLDIKIELRESNTDEAKKLNVLLGEPLVVLHRIRTANGIPVAYTIDRIPKSYFMRGGREIALDDIKAWFAENQSVLAFMRQVLHLEMHHAIAAIKPMTASAVVGEKTLANTLEVPDDTGIFFIEQVEYLVNEKPVIYLHEYHSANYFTFNVYRTY